MWRVILLLAACHSTPKQQPKPEPQRESQPEPKSEPRPEPKPEPPPEPPHAAKQEPAASKCPRKPQPDACPASEPNINHPCKPKGLACTYAEGCCPPVYVCNKTGHFEARFTSCK